MSEYSENHSPFDDLLAALRKANREMVRFNAAMDQLAAKLRCRPKDRKTRIYMHAHRRSHSQQMSYHDALRSVILQRSFAPCDVEHIIESLEKLR